MRTDTVWTNRSGEYIETTKPTGYDLLINGENRYINFNTTHGSLGYGIRDNNGTLQFKHNGGAWADIGSGGGGGTWGSITGTITNQTDLITYLSSNYQPVGSYELTTNKSTSVITDGSSDTKYPSVKAVKDYADGLVAGLLDYRGGYDASGNTYPTTGGSGSAGAVLKGDMWIISVAGTLGGTAVQVGDSLIANVDTPAQTASNWNVLNSNISYVPEDVANKVTSISGSSTDTQYPSAKLVYDQLATKQPTGSYEVTTNKENTTIDTSTTKYPTVNLLKTGLDLRVPYTGATGAVSLGANTLSTTSGLISPKLYPVSNSTTAVQFNKADGTTNVMNIDTTNSRVGIGNTSPAFALDVVGDIKLSGTNPRLKIDASGYAGLEYFLSGTRKWLVFNGSGDSFVWKTDTENKMSLTQNGDVGIGGNITDIGTMAGSSMAIKSGNVGININLPTSRLHAVDGTVAELKFNSGFSALTPSLSVGNTGASGKFAGLIAGTAGAVFEYDSGGFFAISSNSKTNYTNGTLGGGTRRMVITSAGNVGIGDGITPTAYLHIKAGTASAGTAPIKLTSGTLNTTPEAGAIEFLTDAYYGTITTGGARKQFAFTDSNITGSAATLTTARNINGVSFNGSADITIPSYIWTSITGTRTSNTTITVSGDQTAIFKKGTIVTWKESSVDKVGMVSIPSTYSSPNTTITIIGNTCASIDSNSFKYTNMVGVYKKPFPVAGNIGATGTNVANAWYADKPYSVIGAEISVGTAGTTNNTTVDINKGGTTMFTTKPTLATTVAFATTPFTADTATALALGDKVTLDIDAVQTTNAIDLYVDLLIFESRYLTLS